MAMTGPASIQRAPHVLFMLRAHGSRHPSVITLTLRDPGMQRKLQTLTC